MAGRYRGLLLNGFANRVAWEGLARAIRHVLDFGRQTGKTATRAEMRGIAGVNKVIDVGPRWVYIVGIQRDI